MPKVATELSAIQVKRLTEPGCHAVGGVPGLMLRITDTAAASWLLRTVIGGKRSEIGLGSYPEVSLASARTKAAELRARIKQGYDPRSERKAAQQGTERTFEAVAGAYIEAHRAGWRNAKHGDQWANTLKTYAFPIIGDKPVADVTVADVLAVLTPIWTVKPETASRVRNRVELVLAYAMALEYRPRGLNPATWRGHLDQLLPKRSKVEQVQHHQAVDYRNVQDFLKLLRNMPGMGARCLEFVLFTACRSGEARGATWPEFDLAEKVWSIPVERMKARRPHRVPLADCVVTLLQNLPRLEGSDLVFWGAKAGKPISDMTLTACMRRMGLDAVPHGIRSTFRDWAAETTATPNEVVEMALAHAVGNATEAAYRRGDLFDKRRQLMAAWAAYLSAPARGKNVVPIRAA